MAKIIAFEEGTPRAVIALLCEEDPEDIEEMIIIFKYKKNKDVQYIYSGGSVLRLVGDMEAVKLCMLEAIE